MRNITHSPFQRGATPRKAIMPINSYEEGAEEGLASFQEGDLVDEQSLEDRKRIFKLLQKLRAGLGFSEAVSGSASADAIGSVLDFAEVEYREKPDRNFIDIFKKDLEDINAARFRREMAQGGLASIPRYAEGEEVEVEEETSTGEDILEFLRNFKGVAGGVSIQDILELFRGVSADTSDTPDLNDAIEQLMGQMPERMAKGGVVPGSNPVQGAVGGPTVGFKGHMAAQRNMDKFQRETGMTPGDYSRSYGHSIDMHDPRAVDTAIFGLKLKQMQKAQTPPPPPPETPDPVLPQTADELITVGTPEKPGVVRNPAQVVSGVDTMQDLRDVFSSPPPPIYKRNGGSTSPTPQTINYMQMPEYETKQQPANYAQQAASAQGQVATGGLGLASLDGGQLGIKELLALAGIT